MRVVLVLGLVRMRMLVWSKRRRVRVLVKVVGAVTRPRRLRRRWLVLELIVRVPS